MFGKLALRNVKRQIGNYLIYFITVSITVALMFAVNNVIFCEELMAQAESLRELKVGLVAITVFVALIVAFVLGYATSFMLRLRKREFGTYLTLGMTRGNILCVFILETMLLCVAALAVGMLLGMFVYQGLMALVNRLLEMQFSIASYSMEGLLLTVVLVAGVFGLASLTSALYLKRVSIYKLLHGDRIVEKTVRHPFAWLLLALASLAGVIGCCVVFSQQMRLMMTGTGGSAGAMMGSLLVLAVVIVTFHIGLARSLVPLLLRSDAYRCRGTNAFTLRQLSGKLGANAVMAGALAFLLTFAVIGANVSFVQKVSERLTIDKSYPFDVMASLNEQGEMPIPLQEAERIIERYAHIERKLPYCVYRTGDNYLHSFTPWSGEAYAGVEDSILAESDLNRLLDALGEPPVELNGGFLIVADSPQVEGCDFSQATLQLGGKAYSYAGMRTDLPRLDFYYFAAVVPDEAVAGLPLQAECMAYDLAEGKFDAQALWRDLSYTYTSSYYSNGEEITFTSERSDYQIREYGRIMQQGNTAVFVVGALYIAMVFVFLVMAILALKTLSGLSEDRRRYAILFRLGAGPREQSKTLFRQIFTFFLLPFALPLLMSVPTAVICMQIMRLGGFAENMWEVALNAGAIAGVVLVIYALYFTATYLIAKRNFVRDTV